jgi:hypothetical protein
VLVRWRSSGELGRAMCVLRLAIPRYAGDDWFMATREEAFAALASLNPAPVFLESYRSERLPNNLYICFGPPEEFFLAPETQDSYTEGLLIPILDNGNFDLVTFLDPATRSLVQKYVEEPAHVQAVFTNWQQYLADLFIRMTEGIFDDDSEARLGGVSIGFAHIEETLRFLDRMTGLASEEYYAARAEFIASIAP